MPIKAIIFDLDGTITVPILDFDLIRTELGLAKDSGPVLESVEKFSETERKEAEKVLHIHEQRALANSALNPGARETVLKLRNDGLSLAILTRNTSENAYAIIEKHGLTFDIVIGREDGPVKPDAFGVLHICQRLSVSPAETMLVGDYLFDLLSAKAAGAMAVLLVNGDNAEDFSIHADFTIEKLEQIIQIVEDINNSKTV